MIRCSFSLSFGNGTKSFFTVVTFPSGMNSSFLHKPTERLIHLISSNLFLIFIYSVILSIMHNVQAVLALLLAVKSIRLLTECVFSAIMSKL